MKGRPYNCNEDFNSAACESEEHQRAMTIVPDSWWIFLEEECKDEGWSAWKSWGCHPALGQDQGAAHSQPGQGHQQGSRTSRAALHAGSLLERL